MGISSASGRSATSRTVSPARFTTQTRFGKRPQGISYENGRRSSSRMANAPSGDGSDRVCIRASPSPNGGSHDVCLDVHHHELTQSEVLEQVRVVRVQAIRSAYVRACATTPPAFVLHPGHPDARTWPRPDGGLFAGTGRALVVGSSQE